MADHASLYILLACVFGFLMTWGVGANDLANIMSTTMGSKAITVRQAMVIAVIFEFAGAYFGGSGVTDTLRNGIINTGALSNNPKILADGMLALLVAGMTWMGLASYLGMPVSITNAIVGSMVGFGLVVLGPSAIHWKTVTYIAISWISSPMLAGVLAYLLMTSIHVFIFARRKPIKHARRLMPLYLFLVGLILSFITVLKGLRHFGIEITLTTEIILTAGSGLLIMVLGYIPIRRIAEEAVGVPRRKRFEYVERMFALLMALTACAMVFAHGANDVSIAVGPMTVVITLARGNGASLLTDNYPGWIVFLGCTGVITGMLMYGRKVIETVGSGITALTPSRAFAATLAAATAVVVSTSTGIPVSATQTLVGGVLGVGLARGIGALNMIVIRNIFMSWIITIPVASLLTIGYYHLFLLLS